MSDIMQTGFSATDTKVFVIGANKTGTTSLGDFLKRAGFQLGDQLTAEKLMDQWATRNWTPILEYCKSGNAFQDLPFSLDYTYCVLDAAFPGSKFILSRRESADKWVTSYLNHLRRTVGSDQLSYDVLYNFTNNHPKGWLVYNIETIFGWDPKVPFDEAFLKAWYERRNQEIRFYFRSRSDDFLELNIDRDNKEDVLCDFLGLDGLVELGHLNSSPQKA